VEERRASHSKVVDTEREIRTVYQRPQSIADALDAMAGGQAMVLSGGTDIYPAHAGKPLSRPVVDISAVAGLRGISFDNGQYRIGGNSTWTDILAAPLPRVFDGLKAAAREVGSIQIQNRGTIAGNLCNASPAADGVPPLLTLDASVELVSARGIRTMPLGRFMTGYRQTVLAPDEILSGVLVKPPALQARSGFVKLGARRYLVISIVMAAAVIERDRKGTITRAAVAVGAASPVAQRLGALERDLMGLERGVAPSSVMARHHVEQLSPIGDVRATAAYRLEAAMTVVARALDLAAGLPSHG
jgi:CO/xanthine dehydrogenase FAD-binding subunit